MTLGENLVHNRHLIFISIPSASSLRSELQSEHQQLQQAYTSDFPSSPQALPKYHTQTNCNHLQLCQQVLNLSLIINRMRKQVNAPNALWRLHKWGLLSQFEDKVFKFLGNSSSSPVPEFQILFNCLGHQPLQSNSKTQMWPTLFSCIPVPSSFPACNARVVFKTNENGTQEAKWIHLALCSLLPCCYLFLCISLEATFVNMAAEKPQARENCFCKKQIT